MFNIDSSKFTEIRLQENKNIPTKAKYIEIFFLKGDYLTVVHMVRNIKANFPFLFPGPKTLYTGGVVQLCWE